MVCLVDNIEKCKDKYLAHNRSGTDGCTAFFVISLTLLLLRVFSRNATSRRPCPAVQIVFVILQETNELFCIYPSIYILFIFFHCWNQITFSQSALLCAGPGPAVVRRIVGFVIFFWAAVRTGDKKWLNINLEHFRIKARRSSSGYKAF